MPHTAAPRARVRYLYDFPNSPHCQQSPLAPSTCLLYASFNKTSIGLICLPVLTSLYLNTALTFLCDPLRYSLYFSWVVVNFSLIISPVICCWTLAHQPASWHPVCSEEGLCVPFNKREFNRIGTEFQDRPDNLKGWLAKHSLHCYQNALLNAQLVKNPPAMQETWVRSLGWEDPLEKGKATHSSVVGWRIPWAI